MNFYVRKTVVQDEVESTVNSLMEQGFTVSVMDLCESEKELFYEIVADSATLKRKIKTISRKGFQSIEWEERDAVIEGKEFVLTAWLETNAKFLVTGYRSWGSPVSDCD